MKIRLTTDPHITGTYLRLPTEDGKPSALALQGSWYEATATDEDGNDYSVYWTIRDSWSGDDEDDACDWDTPAAVVQDDPWRDVTALVDGIQF